MENLFVFIDIFLFSCRIIHCSTRLKLKLPIFSYLMKSFSICPLVLG